MNSTANTKEQNPTTYAQVSLNKVMGRKIGTKNKDQRQYSNMEMSERIASFNAMRNAPQARDETESNPSAIAAKREERLQSYNRSRSSPSFSPLGIRHVKGIPAAQRLDSTFSQVARDTTNQSFVPELPPPLSSALPRAQTHEAPLQPQQHPGASAHNVVPNANSAQTASKASQTAHAPSAAWSVE